jgi:hypothetical protein
MAEDISHLTLSAKTRNRGKLLKISGVIIVISPCRPIVLEVMVNPVGPKPHGSIGRDAVRHGWCGQEHGQGECN